MDAAAERDYEVALAGFHVPMPEGYEAKLVERLKRRDEAAFNELVRLYETKIFRLVLRMLGGDRAEAEDLAQEVFVTVFKSIDSFRGESKLSTWIYRVAANHSKNRIKYLHRRTRGGRKEFDETADRDALESGSMATSAQVPRPDSMAEAKEVEGIIQIALGVLDLEQRELVILRDIENLTYEEIQDVTGLPEGTVKSRLHRARNALQEKVEELMRAKDKGP
jgi:RNA polymerase sigma-70 factor (ECF subfamily)